MEIIDVPKRKMKIIREDYQDYKIDTWFSSIFIKVQDNYGVSFEEFYIQHIKNNLIVPDNKNVYIFCFSDYSDIDKFLSELQSDGHDDLKKSDIFIYLGDEDRLKKINIW